MQRTSAFSAVVGVIAGCFSISAFIVAIMAGLLADLSAAQILLRSLITLMVCYPVGIIVGLACQHVIRTQVEAHEQANPLREAPPREQAAESEEQEPITV